jgi:putative heme iron utilization protein
MAHETRLTQGLRHLLHARRVAALGTLTESGEPAVSMVPFAIDAGQACIVIHVSGLAAHTRNLQDNPAVSLLVMQGEVETEPVHALPRVTLEGRAEAPETGSTRWKSARTAYLSRFPEAEPMTRLADFVFVTIRPTAARQIAGFGAARSIDATELVRLLGSDPAGPVAAAR